MVKAGLRNVAAGANAITLKKGIDKASDFLVGKIKDMAKPIADSNAIAQVGTISAGNDEVGKMIADAMDKVGKEGVISLEGQVHENRRGHRGHALRQGLHLPLLRH